MRIVVTTHAVKRYIKRIRDTSPNIARYEIARALENPLFVCVEPITKNGMKKLKLYGCINIAGYPFLAACSDIEGGIACVTVGPTYHWHESKKYWAMFVKKTAVKSGPSAIQKELIRKCLSTKR